LRSYLDEAPGHWIDSWADHRERVARSLKRIVPVDYFREDNAAGGILIFLITCVLIVSRRPDAMLNPQFFAEDGTIWFADAWNLGWFNTIFLPYNGYLSTVPRLAAAVALLAHASIAPLIMNLTGLVVQALPVSVLLSSRCSGWGSLQSRAALSLIYVALPNSQEIHVLVTNVQWHLALLSCILVLASVPKSAAWRAFDITIFALGGLTGPFSVLLLPVAMFFLWLKRDVWRWVPIGILTLTAIVQVIVLLTAYSSRPNAPPRATWELLVRILGGQVYLGALIGPNWLSILGSLAFLSCVAAVGTAVFVYSWALSHCEARLFGLFAMIVFAASLWSPTDGWKVLAGAPGIRYWFFPMLAFSWSLVWSLAGRGSTRLSRVVSGALLIVMCFGVLRDWEYPAFVDLHFSGYVNELKSAAPGTSVVIPENPPGWFIKLVARPE
jgi:hypothetical protein